MRHQLGFKSISEITYSRVRQIHSFKFFALISLVSFVMNFSQPFGYIPFLYYHTLVTTILKNSRVPLNKYFVPDDMLLNS